MASSGVAPANVPAAELPLGSLTLDVAAVPLPKGTDRIRALAARDEKGAWFLSSKGEVFEWDGRETKSIGTPFCVADACCGTLIDCQKEPKLCTKKAMETCSAFSGQRCGMPVEFSGLTYAKGELVADAYVNTGGLRGSYVGARRSKSGKWICEQGGGDTILPGQVARGAWGSSNVETLGDGARFEFEGPAYLINPLGGISVVVDGRRLRLPDDLGWQPSTVVAAAADDLWLYNAAADWVYRGDGRNWQKVPLDVGPLEDMWILRSSSAPPGYDLWGRNADSLVQLDWQTGSWRRLAQPGADMLRTFDGGFWLIGKSRVLRWDGEHLAAAEVPAAVEDIWVSPKGEIWVVGAELPDSPTSPGAALRLSVAKNAGQR